MVSTNNDPFTHHGAYVHEEVSKIKFKFISFIEFYHKAQKLLLRFD